MPKRYLVIYDYDFIIVIAKSIKECVEKLADYTGNKDQLLTKAFNGCEEPQDYINMFNRFANYTINSICELGNKIYADAGIEEHYTIK